MIKPNVDLKINIIEPDVVNPTVYDVWEINFYPKKTNNILYNLINLARCGATNVVFIIVIDISEW